MIELNCNSLSSKRFLTDISNTKRKEGNTWQILVVVHTVLATGTQRTATATARTISAMAIRLIQTAVPATVLATDTHYIATATVRMTLAMVIGFIPTAVLATISAMVIRLIPEHPAPLAATAKSSLFHWAVAIATAQQPIQKEINNGKYHVK